MSKDDSQYKEFDDVDFSHYPYISSKKARDATIMLMNEHGLGFLNNPGGGQFTCIDTRYPLYGFNCQVSTYDNVQDLNTLRAAIKKALG